MSTISNNSVAIIEKDGPVQIAIPHKKNPTLGDVAAVAGRVGHAIKAAAIEVAVRGAYMACLPLYGPIAAARNPWAAPAPPFNIVVIEGCVLAISVMAMALGASAYGSLPNLAAALGLSGTMTGANEVVALSLLAGPALVGGITGLMTDYREAKYCLRHSPLIKRLRDIEIPLDRILGPAQPPQLKR